jgi:hypothetical protein
MTPSNGPDRELRKAYGRIVARAWSDPVFAARVEQDPAGVMREHGIDVGAAAGFRIAVPSRPPDTLDVESLGPQAGGSTVGSAGTSGSIGTVCGTVASAFSVGTAGTAR